MNPPPSHFDYHGLHVAVPQEQAVRVRWAESTKRAARIRIKEHTCFCTHPTYEFCTAGGLWFVRRLPEEGTTMESPWLPADTARALWLRIVTGQAY
ncbi:hypothetical protein AB0I81_14840 [Nonomuraea sp. NPDC050404]|uniref:hypothetical protein n=1 Tax=Nonomuraea sp. NPDC050404 TaxID=3155783 RepID=UPI0033D6D40A